VESMDKIGWAKTSIVQNYSAKKEHIRSFSLISHDYSTTMEEQNKQDKEGKGQEHEFTFVYMRNIASFSYHLRQCKVCGAEQRYGRYYGSNKYPGYETIDPICPGRKEEEKETQQKWRSPASGVVRAS